jgi:hypothetical protein
MARTRYGDYKKKKTEMGLLFGGFVREGPQLFIFTSHSTTRAFFHYFFSFGREAAFFLSFLLFLALLYFISCSMCFASGVFLLSLCILNIWGGGGHGRLLNTWSLLSCFLFSPYLLAALVGLGFTSLVYKYGALPQKDSGLLKCSIRRAMISRVLGCMLSYCCFWSMG